MNLLAFDTSTDTLSIAVQHGDAVWQHTGPGGAQASATLIPTVRSLMAQAGLSFDTLEAIVFGRGPGSFTGLRTACAVAQGLAFGARGGQGVPVLPVDTLLAVAEEARHAHGCTQVVAVLDARMDEVYVATYRLQDQKLMAQDAPRLCRPEDLHLAVPPTAGTVLAGNAAAVYGERFDPALRALPHVQALPTATALLRLAPEALARGLAVTSAEAQPLYVRDKVAQTTAEREAIKLAQAMGGA